MTHARRMIETNPSDPAVDAEALVECIDACFDCAQACTACADACLGEEDVQMLTRCIRLDLDCANVCAATGKILSRQTAFEPQMAREPWTPAPKRAGCAARSASSTPSTAWSTAVSAQRPAAVASRHATTFFLRWVPR